MTTLSPKDHLDIYSQYTNTISEVSVSAAIAKVLEAGANVGIVTNSDGTITITPTFAGLSVIYVDGTTVAGSGTSASPLHMIGLPSNISISPAIITPLTYGTFYSQQLVQHGGSGAVTFAVTTGTLPEGITLTTTGLLSGTPTAHGQSLFIITATDAVGITGKHSYSVEALPIALTLSPMLLPNPISGSAYSQHLSVLGGTGPYTYSLLFGSLPQGLALTGNTIAGLPSTVSSTYFTIKATDSVGNFGTKNYAIAVTGPVVLGPTVLNAGAAGSFYAQNIVATGGSNSEFVFTIPNGTLPVGLSLSPTGVLSGVPTSMGSTVLTIMVTDSLGNTATHNYTLTINNALSLTPAGVLPDAFVSTTYSQLLTANGGSGGGYVFSLNSGSLPTGFSLLNGSISGLPAVAGNYSFAIKATDSNGSYIVKNYSIDVNTVILTLSDLVAPSGVIGLSFSQAVHASGGTGSYTSYWISEGTFPPGLSFSGNTITGTPTNNGNYQFTISVVDSAGDTGTKDYSITIS